MLADIGTKPLASVRFEFLKKLIGMDSLSVKSEEKIEVEEKVKEKEKIEVEEKERKKEGEKRSEKQDGCEANKDGHRLAEAAQVLRLITLAATLSISKAEGDGEGAEEMVSFEIIILYTFAVVFITLMAQRIWEAGVRGARFLRQHVLAQPGSHSERAVGDLQTLPQRKTCDLWRHQAQAAPSKKLDDHRLCQLIFYQANMLRYHEINMLSYHEFNDVHKNQNELCGEMKLRYQMINQKDQHHQRQRLNVISYVNGMRLNAKKGW